MLFGFLALFFGAKLMNGVCGGWPLFFSLSGISKGRCRDDFNVDSLKSVGNGSHSPSQCRSLLLGVVCGAAARQIRTPANNKKKRNGGKPKQYEKHGVWELGVVK
ncbi:uncharacterized protein TM35_000292650 [Trypanosoma theileri]|uniref:Secreted protein n=1 Tax=Trypanosoma theileri TaxID=67003 RepID=A0A1X0NPG7_9TRYP|nr:uncharacterized protein TM35_000292650 [Trypanosoma theileri]ORC86383.1 hypothetical protein TM35_000292650 [Trypanosoma theileri]